MRIAGLSTTAPSPGFASLVVFLSASIWGLYWVPLRYLNSQGIEGGWAVALLNLPAALVLAGVFIAQWQQQRHYLKHAVIIGFFTGLGLALYTCGILYSSVVRVTLLFYVTPVWATLIGIVWLGERAGWQRWAAIGIGLLGLLLLVSAGEGAMPLNIGDAFALLSGMAWAIGAAMIKRYDDVPLAGMNMFQFLFTALLAVLLGSAAVSMPFASEMLLRAIPAAALVSVLIILPSVWVIFWAQKFLFPGRAGLLMMSEVLVAVVSASIFLPQEQLSWLEWGGAALIISACLIEVLATPSEAPMPQRLG